MKSGQTRLPYSHADKLKTTLKLMKLSAYLVKPTTNELTSAASETQSRSVDEELVVLASQVHTQRLGRPAFGIKEDQLSFLLDNGFDIATTALLFRASSRTVERRNKKYALFVLPKQVIAFLDNHETIDLFRLYI